MGSNIDRPGKWRGDRWISSIPFHFIPIKQLFSAERKIYKNKKLRWEFVKIEIVNELLERKSMKLKCSMQFFKVSNNFIYFFSLCSISTLDHHEHME